MSESLQGVSVFVAVALAASVLAHVLVRRYFRACVAAGVVSSALFNLLATLHAGRPDKLFGVAFLMAGLYATAIAAIVGLPFARRRRRARNSAAATSSSRP